VAECLHFINVEGIPVGSSEKLSSFYQVVSSLILLKEVVRIVDRNWNFVGKL